MWISSRHTKRARFFSQFWKNFLSKNGLNCYGRPIELIFPCLSSLFSKLYWISGIFVLTRNKICQMYTHFFTLKLNVCSLFLLSNIGLFNENIAFLWKNPKFFFQLYVSFSYMFIFKYNCILIYNYFGLSYLFLMCILIYDYTLSR